MFARLAAAVTLASAAITAVQAQAGLSGVGLQCYLSISSLSQSSFGQCSAFSYLLPIALSPGPIVGPQQALQERWLEVLCDGNSTEAACSQGAIKNGTDILDQGCSSELNSNNTAVTGLRYFINHFDQLQPGLCLHRTNNNTYCLPELLYKLEVALQEPLTLGTISALNASVLNNVSANAYCTDCLHGLVSEFAPLYNSSNMSSTSLGNEIEQKCGASFLNGSVPDTLSTSGNTSMSSSNGQSNATTGSSAATSGASGSVPGILAAGPLALFAAGLVLLL